MNKLLTFVSPLEFLLRYTVITGIILACIGTAICLLAKHITMAVRNAESVGKNDKLYLGLMIAGFSFILIGIIVIALPIDATFYG